jgi:hypothetical protein
MSKGLIVISDEQRRLVLRSVRVQIVPMAKTMGIIIPHDWNPIALQLNFQLHGKPHDRSTRPKVRAPDLSLSRRDPNEPGAHR